MVIKEEKYGKRKIRSFMRTNQNRHMQGNGRIGQERMMMDQTERGFNNKGKNTMHNNNKRRKGENGDNKFSFNRMNPDKKNDRSNGFKKDNGRTSLKRNNKNKNENEKEEKNNE